MSPGDISHLVLSRQVAFRAEFKGPIPPPARRYWRGLTLWRYDGAAWRKAFAFPPLIGPVRGESIVGLHRDPGA